MGKLQFYVSQKWAQYHDVETFEEWREANPEACEKLLKIHRIYRTYKAENPENEWIESAQGEIPQQIIQQLETMSYFTTNFVDDYSYACELEEVEDLLEAYPGLEVKNVIADSLSLGMVVFNTEFDLENPDERIFPAIKWAQGNFSFKVELTVEQFETRKDSSSFQGLWADVNLVIGGHWYHYREMSSGGYQYKD